MNRRGVATLAILAVVIASIISASTYLRATAARQSTGKQSNAGDLSGAPVIIPPCVDKDSRQNSACAQPDQPVAVFCQANGDIKFIPIPADNKDHIIPASLVNSVPSNPDVNTYIGSVNVTTFGVAVTVRLYRLHGGQLQINVPRPYAPDHKEYVFIWKGCTANK